MLDKPDFRVSSDLCRPKDFSLKYNFSSQGLIVLSMAPSNNVKYKGDLGSIVYNKGNREPSNHLKTKQQQQQQKRDKEKKEEEEEETKGRKEDDRTNDLFFLHFISNGQII